MNRSHLPPVLLILHPSAFILRLGPLAEAQLKRQERGGQLSRDRDVFATQLFDRHRLAGDDHRAVLVTHAAAATRQRVFFRDVRVGVDADGGDLQLTLHRALVQRLDVLKDVFEPPVSGRDERRILRQGVKHEGVVRVGRMAEAQQRGRAHECGEV